MHSIGLDSSPITSCSRRRSRSTSWVKKRVASSFWRDRLQKLFLFISVGFESSPWRKDGGAGVRQGDLAAADVQHLKDFSFFDGWSDGDDQHQGEAEDGEGHDGQGDAKDQAPGGEKASMGKWQKHGSTWECRPGLQGLWQRREPSTRGAAARSSRPPSTWRSSICFGTSGINVEGHLDEAREAPVGQGTLLGVHCRVTQPVTAKVQRQLKGFVSILDFQIFSYCISSSPLFLHFL